MNGFQIPHFGIKRQYQYLKKELFDYTDLVFRSGQYLDGIFTDKIEEWLRIRTGYRHALTVHSGTQALEIIALYESSLFDDDNTPTIRIPNITYPATLNAFMTSGWNVELIDTDQNGLIRMPEFSMIEYEKYTCFVGLYGAVPDDGLNGNILVDGAQHWLAESTPKFSTAISFDPTKNLYASGNGGAILTNDSGLYTFAKSFKNNGKPDHEVQGTNSRMSELDCAHLFVRTRYIDKWQDRRKEIRLYYLEQFENLPIRCLSRDFTFHMDQKFVIYTDKRNELNQYLQDSNIESKIHYPYTLSELPMTWYIETKPDLLSTSTMLSRGVLSLPIHPELTDAEIEYIVSKVKQFYE